MFNYTLKSGTNLIKSCRLIILEVGASPREEGGAFFLVPKICNFNRWAAGGEEIRLDQHISLKLIPFLYPYKYWNFFMAYNGK